MYAIVEIAGKQYKVAKNDKIEVDRLSTEKGKVTFDTVLLYAKDEKNVEIGNPYVSGVKVEAEVIGQTQGEKIRVFKMKAKKRYRKTIGHRTDFTMIEIKDISTGGAKKETKEVKEEAPVDKPVAKKAVAKKPAAKKTTKKKE